MSCVIFFVVGKCETPTQLSQGQVVFDDLTAGAKARYNCNKGYELIGAKTLSCNLLSGLGAFWDGQKPTCRGMFKILLESLLWQ